MFDVAEYFFGVARLDGEVVDRHIGTFTGIGDGSGPPDTGITAGDKGLATEQAAETRITLFAMIGSGAHLTNETGGDCGCRGNGGEGYWYRGSCIVKRSAMVISLSF